MNLTLKQLKIISKQINRKLIGKSCSIMTTLGYYQPRNANWAYVVGWDYYGNLVITQFGQVVALI